jgi:hypothetical protein
VFRGESIEAVDGVPESAGVPNMFPCEGGQARWTRIGQQRQAQCSTAWNWSAGTDGVLGLTAKRSDGSVDGLDEHALTVKLQINKHQLVRKERDHRFFRGSAWPTSSRVLASSSIQPSSMTSAESLVT